MAKLGPEAACIFRITHVNNVLWILDHGLHCKSSDKNDPSFIPIGLSDLIERRTSRTVPIGPGGTLADYVPFYFTPWSVMGYNIKTGRNVTQRPNSEIVILVSSLHKLQEVKTRFVFTNAHAYLEETDYFKELSDLDQIDWELLRKKDFKKDPDDPGKMGRYQAEALAYKHVPIDGLIGIACYDDTIRRQIESHARSRGLSIPVRTVPDWYF